MTVKTGSGTVTGPRDVGWDRGNSKGRGTGAPVVSGDKLVPFPHNQQKAVNKAEPTLTGPISGTALRPGTNGR